MIRSNHRQACGLAAFFVLMTVPGLPLAQAQESADRLKRTLEGHTDPVYAVAWSRDGQTIATAGFDGTVRLWNAASRKQIKRLEGHTKLVLAVAFSPDGTRVVSGSLDKTARIWSTPSSGASRKLAGPGSNPVACGKPRRQAGCRRLRKRGQDLRPRHGQGSQRPGSSRQRSGQSGLGQTPRAARLR